LTAIIFSGEIELLRLLASLESQPKARNTGIVLH